MAGVDKVTPVETARELYTIKPNIPLLLLVNNNADLLFFKREVKKLDFIDRIFVWNGNSNVFVAEDIAAVSNPKKKFDIRCLTRQPFFKPKVQ